MKANDNTVHLNRLSAIEASDLITKELMEANLIKIQELNSMTWTASSASTNNTYSSNSQVLYKPWPGLRTYNEFKKYVNSEDEKEKEQKERVDNIMNKYGLV